MLVAPSVAASDGVSIGTGNTTCVPGPGANCRDVVHKWTFTHHGDLRGANLTGANLYEAYVSGANLTGANLNWTYLTNTNLTNTNLTNANLTNANLFGASLDAAVLTGVTWSKTTCPDGSITNIGC